MEIDKLKKLFFGLIFFFMIMVCNKSNAAGTVSLSVDKANIYVEDEFSVSVNLNGSSAATLTAKITVDTSKVDYVSGPSNSNFSNGRVIYTWTDPNGGDNPISGNIATFKFKSKAVGKANFSVSGDFFGADENSLNPSFSGTSINISEKPAVSPETGGNEGGNTGGNSGNNSNGSTGSSNGSSGGNSSSNVGGPSGGTNSSNSNNGNNEAKSNNANLKSLHLSIEGLSPAFNKNTTNYYIVVPENITNINVIAEAEDSSSKIDISGNNNLQMGENKIQIAVTAPNNKSKKIYIINVTRTSSLENANANLLNLAIENITLEPEFNKDVTQYEVQVGSNIDSINVLAVAEVEGASVDVQGVSNLQFGNNTVNIKVTAKDGATTKEYAISVYRKTEEEEENGIMLIRDGGISLQDGQLDTKESTNKIIAIVVFAVLVLGLGGVAFVMIRKNMKKKR